MRPRVRSYGESSTASAPMIRERVAVRHGRDGQLGGLRVKRHRAAIKAVFASEAGDTATDVKLVEEGGKTLTDLDVVFVDPPRRHVLAVRLKSFVTPTNLLEFDHADKEIAGAVEQCRIPRLGVRPARRPCGPVREFRSIDLRRNDLQAGTRIGERRVGTPDAVGAERRHEIQSLGAARRQAFSEGEKSYGRNHR